MRNTLAIPLLTAAWLSGCAVVPHPERVASAPLPQGTAIALDQPVRTGDLVVTPKAVVEDSRCPINAGCIWPGRLIVTTRIDGDGWRDTADITLGETYGTHGRVIALVSGEPGRTTDRETPLEVYRFKFETR